MPIQKVYNPHSIKIDTYSGVAAWLDEVKSYGPNPGVTLFEESSGSETDREFVAIKSVSPTMPVETFDLSFLGTCGFDGIPIDCDGTHAGLIAYMREHQTGKLPTAIATTNHIMMTVSNGVLVPVSMRVSQDSMATLNLMLYAILGTGTGSVAEGMKFETGKAIASGASAMTKGYTLGPVKYNSTLCKDGIVDLSVDFGITVRPEGDTGNVFPSVAPIVSRMPKIMFTTKDQAVIAAIGNGLAITSFGGYFRKLTKDGDRVSEASTSHIGITGTKGMITPGAVGMTHQSSGTTAFTYTPSKDTNTLTISTSAAIPTT